MIAAQATILVVDDIPTNVQLLDAILHSRGYRVISAGDGREALERVSEQCPDLILCDVVMPVMDGLELCRAIRGDPQTSMLPFIMITASGDQEKLKAIEAGADDFVMKPFNQPELLARIRSLLRIKAYHDRIEEQSVTLADLNHTLEERILARTSDLASALHRIDDILERTVHAVSLTVEMRDPYTAGHQRRVATIARSIGESMGFDAERLRGLYISGVLHDLGKIAVPSEILSKPGKLSDLEFGIIREHPRVGYEILSGIPFPWPVADTVYQHHERLDGSGYPRGLKRDAIILEARILAVADVVEAIASHRPYRPALGIEAAIEEITSHSGVRYDPDVVHHCLNLHRESVLLPS